MNCSDALCRQLRLSTKPATQAKSGGIVYYSTLCIVIHDVVISYGESLMPGTNLRPGENKSEQLEQARLTRWVGT